LYVKRWLRKFGDACAKAWNDLMAETGRIAAITNYPYIRKIRI